MPPYDRAKCCLCAKWYCTMMAACTCTTNSEEFVNTTFNFGCKLFDCQWSSILLKEPEGISILHMTRYAWHFHHSITLKTPENSCQFRFYCCIHFVVDGARNKSKPAGALCMVGSTRNCCQITAKLPNNFQPLVPTQCM
jgi:hypothetical protein